MSMRTAIYNALAFDPVLSEMLAEKPADLGHGPAIYETWAPPGSDMPYMNLTYSIGPGADTLKRQGTLEIDLFVEGSDTVVIEQINRRIKGALHKLRIRDAEDGPIFLTLENENDIPEDVENVIHWNTTFLLRYWDRSTLDILLHR